MNISKLSKQMSRNDLARYGGTPLGVVALKRGVFNLKDSYTRRNKLVSEWARTKFGEEFSDGVYHAVNGKRCYRNNPEYRKGYEQGRQLLSRWD